MAAEQIIREDAPAKVNLYLHVTGKRDDGYHLLDSLVAFADYGDRIHVSKADKLSLSYEGPFAGELPPPKDNLIYSAAQKLQKEFHIDVGAALVLEKNLPVASGIGGGSSDAAAAIRALCRLWKISRSDPAILNLALTLGADVPVCIANSTAVMRGIGEDIRPLQHFPNIPIVLVNLGISVPTPDVFRARSAIFSKQSDWHDENYATNDVIALISERTNDLEPPAIGIAPEIAGVLDALRKTTGVGLARMSGSGATCFALFSDRTAATKAAQELKLTYPTWWIQAAQVG